MSTVPCDYCHPFARQALDTSDGLSAASASQGDGEKEETGGAAAAAAAADAPMYAVKMCLKCEVSMCQEHVKPHLELPAFREHPLTEPMNDFWKRKCPEHEEMFR